MLHLVPRRIECPGKRGQRSAAEGSPLQGATYLFLDNEVDAGRAYHYQIEELSSAGLGRRHPDTIEAVAADGRWQRIESWLALLVGLGLTPKMLRPTDTSRSSTWTVRPATVRFASICAVA
jgi:hypothetical protein